MTLYELDDRFQNFELEINEDGEVINADDLEKIEMERNEKLENVALYIKNARADRDALKAEKKRIDERLKTESNKVEWMERYLQNHLHGEKIKTPKVSVSYRKTKSVVCEHPEYLEHRFQRVKVDADKKAIADAIKSGEKVEGAHLEEKVSMVLK